ncbi:nucleotide exchange factor GrpE [Patescibacteria group bacterium]|nr:MAG: nucleotide exchange factor GrpE [Patescibacteria group bacterium]
MVDENDVVIDSEDESLEGEGSSATKLNQKVKSLREQLEKVQKERQEYLDGWQRAKADYVNVKRRAEDERVFFVRSASTEIVQSLLPSLDSFEHALEAEQGTSAWTEGIKNTHAQLLKALETEGVQSFDPVGEMFDPLRHESVEIVAVKSEKEDNIVTKTHQKGYTLHDVVIRPARVAVAHYKNS